MANDNLTLGAKLGMTVSNQTNTDIDSKIGFEIGGAHRHGLSELLALNTELSYVQKGSKFGDRLVIDLSQALSNVRVSRNYIQLAVHISADIIKSNQFFIPEPYLGFSTGYLLSANLSGDSIGGDKVSRDVRDDFKNLEFGILFGMGFRVFRKIYNGSQIQSWAIFNRRGVRDKEQNAFLFNGLFLCQIGSAVVPPI